MEFSVRNVNEALCVVWHWMNSGDKKVQTKDSRNGPTLEVSEPVMTIYRRPMERVLFAPERNANPFFHLFEAMWMLGNRNDVEWLARYNKKMLDFSDDGKTLYGSSYGKRWASMLNATLDRLYHDKDTRRAYIPIFRVEDTRYDGKDLPCNVGIDLKIRNNQLDMTVFNRSNDMLWGAYGANAVHFSVFQEYVANALGLLVGHYAQVSSSFHIYTEFPVTKNMAAMVDTKPFDPYDIGMVHPYPGRIVENVVSFPHDLQTWLYQPNQVPIGCKNPFFPHVLVPMHRAWVRRDSYWEAVGELNACKATDWQLAATKWLQRRDTARKEA